MTARPRRRRGREERGRRKARRGKGPGGPRSLQNCRRASRFVVGSIPTPLRHAYPSNIRRSALDPIRLSRHCHTSRIVAYGYRAPIGPRMFDARNQVEIAEAMTTRSWLSVIMIFVHCSHSRRASSTRVSWIHRSLVGDRPLGSFITASSSSRVRALRCIGSAPTNMSTNESSDHSRREGFHGPRSRNPADVEVATEDGGGEESVGGGHGFAWSHR